MSTCDICGESTSWEEGTGYSADEFRRLVGLGFSPVDRMQAQLAMVRALTGQSTEQFLAQWKQGLVAQCTTDWLLCPECARAAGRYLPKAAGGGRTGAPLWEPFTPAMLTGGKSSGSSDVVAGLAGLAPLLSSTSTVRSSSEPERWTGFAPRDCIRTVVFLAVLLGLFGVALRFRGVSRKDTPVVAPTVAQAAPAPVSPVALAPGHPVLQAGEKLIFPAGTTMVDTSAGRILYTDAVQIQPAGRSDWEYEIRPVGGAPLKLKVNRGGLEGVIGVVTDDGVFHLGADLKTEDGRLIWIHQTAEVFDRNGSKLGLAERL